MNWRKRTKTSDAFIQGSVTFSLKDAWKISQPKTLMDLSVDFINFVTERGLSSGSFSPNLMTVSPDHDSYEKHTGNINVYVPVVKRVYPEHQSAHDQISARLEDNLGTKERNSLVSQMQKMEYVLSPNFNKKDYETAIRAYIQDKQVEGYQISYILEKSSYTGGPVYIIRISVNPTSSLLKIPEAVIPSNRASELFYALGLPQKSTGSIGLADLKNRISEASKAQSAKYYESYSNDFDSELQDLYELVDYGLSRGFSVAIWE